MKKRGKAAIPGFKFSAYMRKKYKLVKDSTKGKKSQRKAAAVPMPPELQKVVEKYKVSVSNGPEL